MATARIHFNEDELLATIREHGPLTKTEMHYRTVGYADCKSLMIALHELQRRKLISYGQGRAKANGRIARVYSVAS